MKLLGIHHITAIADDPQRNVDFYRKILGLRLVKRTVNFDDPSSYHFYFAIEPALLEQSSHSFRGRARAWHARKQPGCRQQLRHPAGIAQLLERSSKGT